MVRLDYKLVAMNTVASKLALRIHSVETTKMKMAIENLCPRVSGRAHRLPSPALDLVGASEVVRLLSRQDSQHATPPKSQNL